MADNPMLLSAVKGALSVDFRPRVMRTVNRRARTLRLLRAEKGGGQAFFKSIELSGALAETYAEGADVSNTGTDAVAAFTLPWARYRANFKVTGDVEAAAATSTSPADFMRPLFRSLENGIMAAASAMNVDVFSGGGGNAMVGLGTALLDNNTYGTIDRTQAANTTFRGNVVDPGVSTDVTLDNLAKDIGDTIYTACGEQPDLAICSPKVFYTIRNKFFPNQRFTTDSLDLARGTVKLGYKVEVMDIEGCLFMKDKDATANQIFYLNTQYAYVVLLQQVAETEQFPAYYDLGEQDLNDGGGPMPLGMKVYELGPTGDSRKITAQIKPALVIDRPNACGIRKNVATP